MKLLTSISVQANDRLALLFCFNDALSHFDTLLQVLWVAPVSEYPCECYETNLNLSGSWIPKSEYKDERVLMVSVDTCTCMMIQQNLRETEVGQFFLTSQVRKTTADQFYITLVTYDDIIEAEVADEVIGILSETAWSAIVVGARI